MDKPKIEKAGVSTLSKSGNAPSGNGFAEAGIVCGEAGEAATAGAREDVPRARRGMRLVGYCRVCRCFQELDRDLKDHLRHDRRCMAIIMEMPEEEPLYHIPAFNWGAFLMPPIWGAGHGQVFAVVLYPLWLMVDNLLWAAVKGDGSPALAGVALVGTLAFMFFYARTANHVGYMRAMSRKSPAEYVRDERRWAWAMGAVAAFMLAFATWYNLTVRV